MKRFNFSITDNTTYNGKDLIDFYSKALLEGTSKSTFKVIPGVKSKIQVPRYDAGEIIKDASCAWSSTGEGTLSQKQMEACSKDVQLEICTTTFENNFLSELLRQGSNTGEVAPQQFVDYMINQVSLQIQNDLEIAVWQGDATGSTYPNNICDGILKLADADTGVTSVTTTATALTLSNIIAEMTKVYDAIPQTIINDENLMIYVSTNIYKLYQQAIAAASNEAYYVGAKEPNFLGIPVHWSPGLPSERMVAASSQNLVLLTDLLSDEESLSVIPQFDKSGVRSTRIAGNFKFGVDFLVSEELVTYNVV